MTSKKKKVAFAAVATAVALSVLAWWGWHSYRQHLRLMENIKLATTNPAGMNPGAIIGQIDRGFAKLPEEEKRRILADPQLTAGRIEKACYENYQQAFGTLFSLPAPIRERLIRNSADAISSSIDRNKRKVNDFYESPAGQAALRAASNYFMLELSGRQKNELKPITDAFHKIHQQRVNNPK